ncbi:MAG: GGDEF domain-containing protein, partial [Campylobacterota bacterium]|nr:GGDEF domain-containing protein [Campylobacterota bacterium]
TTETVSKLKLVSKTTPNIMNITQHQKKDGTTYGVQSYIHPITYDKKDAYVIYDIKISDEKRAQEEILRQKQNLAKQAYYDTLTALPNRVLFYDRLSQAITKSKRTNKEFAIMFIDLDNFKEVNDTLGHDTGDLVLIEIAMRLKDSLRGVDTVARLAGDEFLVMIEDIDSKGSVKNIAQKLLNSLSKVLTIDENELYITSSIGVSLYPDHTQDPKVLVKHADQAMYKAKNSGKNSFEFYND